MTTIELNAEITHNLELLADDENAMKKVSNYIKKLLSKKEKPLELTPELQAEIDQARKELAEGKCVTCNTIEELHQFLNSL